MCQASLQGIAGEGPVKRLPLAAVPDSDEFQHPPFEVAHVAEVTMAKHTTGEQRKPQLDLIAPTGVNRRVVKMETATVALVEFRDVLAVVGVEVIPHDVHSLSGIVTGQSLQIRQHFLFGPPPGQVTEDISRVQVEGRGEAAGSLAPVFKFPAAGLCGTGTATGKTAPEGLHTGLLVN
jgi:hypothetical protein